MQPLMWQMLFFTTPIRKAHQKQYTFSWRSQQYNFTILLLLRGMISLQLCLNLVHLDDDCLPLSQDITLVHSIDIMLIGLYKQGVATTLDLLVRHLHVGVGNKSNKNSAVFYLLEIFRGPVIWDMS